MEKGARAELGSTTAIEAGLGEAIAADTLAVVPVRQTPEEWQDQHNRFQVTRIGEIVASQRGQAAA